MHHPLPSRAYTLQKDGAGRAVRFTNQRKANVTTRTFDIKKQPKSIQRLFEEAPPLPEEKERARLFLRQWTLPERPHPDAFKAKAVPAYTLKHMAEEAIGGYVCESSFIAAALEEGYQVRGSRAVVVWPPPGTLKQLRELWKARRRRS